MTPCRLVDFTWLKPLCFQLMAANADGVSESSDSGFPPLPPQDSGTGNHSSTGNHHKGRKRRRQSVGPVCGCNCKDLHWADLGASGIWSQRCRCPLCGHRSFQGGKGCHRRLLVWQAGDCVFCAQCARECVRALQKLDLDEFVFGQDR